MPTFFSRKLFTQTVCNSHTVQLDVSFTHVIFPHNFHLRLWPYASAKQGHACLPCTSSFPVHVAVTSLHESRSRPLQILSHAVHPSVAPKRWKSFWATGVASSAITKKKEVQDNSFRRKLKQRYQRVRPNRNPEDMLIQHDNVLAPSDFHLLGPLKDALRGTRFEEDESVIRAVRSRLREQERSSYREGMHALVSRWCKAVDVDGDYVEKSRV